MKTRTILTLLALFFAPLSPLCAAAKPNIIFFLVDDLGYADCGFNGGKDIKTPHIDRLAREGSILDSLYVQPVCSPTRAALLTGRYPTRTGVYSIVRPGAKWGLPLGERTLASALKDAGYATAIVGKWHLGEFERAYLPTARGFDHQYGHHFGALDYFTHKRGNVVDWYRNDQPLQEEGYTTHLIANEACRLLAGQDRSKPLFLYVPFNGVHGPLQAPDEYLKPYAHLTAPRQKFAGMLTAVDEAVGQIVAAAEKAGLRDNTLIIFCSDNGGTPVSDNSPLSGNKGGIREGGVRGCGFVNWPGKVPAGAHIKKPMHIVDWYPTLVKLAGGSLAQKTPLDGRDVWPMLTQGAKSPHEAILLAGTDGSSAALRMGDWKLVQQRGDADSDDEESPAKPKAKKKADGNLAPLALYNLAEDIGEKQNLADKEPERVAAMKTKLAELMKDAAKPGNQ